MTVNKNYILKDFGGEHVLVKSDDSSVDFSKVITINETGVYIFNLLKEGKEEMDIVKQMTSEYDVSFLEATADVDEFIKELKKNDIIDD